MSKHIVYCFNMQSLFVQLHKKVGKKVGTGAQLLVGAFKSRRSISGPELAG